MAKPAAAPVKPVAARARVLAQNLSFNGYQTWVVTDRRPSLLRAARRCAVRKRTSRL